MRTKHIFILTLIGLTGSIHTAVAGKSFIPSDDNFMYSAAAPTRFSDKNWGENRNILAGINNPALDKYRSLLRFDLSAMDEDTEFSSATLTLTVSVVTKIKPANGNFTVNLFLLDNANKAWKEGKGDGEAKTGASCWDYLDYNKTAWTGEAGVGSSTASAGISALVGSVAIDTSAGVTIGKKIVFTIDSPEGLAAIKSWITGGDNAGFLLATDELSTGQNAIGFYASEATDSSGRPKLEINRDGREAAIAAVRPNTEIVSLYEGVVPNAAEIKPLKGVEFYAIKAYEPHNDGFKWLHGIGLMWHKGNLYASFGHNQGAENTRGEMARYRVSEDGGKTWGKIQTIAVSEGNQAVSHGVFLSHAGQLWAFQGAFYDDFQRTHTRAYLLKETTGEWMPKGIVIEGGFWPLQQPEKMEDGNWIMAGICAPQGFPGKGEIHDNPPDLPAVAISHGDDFTKWDLITVPLSEGLVGPWGESNVIVDGSHITIISRWWWEYPSALVAESKDFGRTWTSLKASNLPMAASKPCAGMLSTGQRYVIANTSADGGNKRNPLTIVYSRPGETVLSGIRMIRRDDQPDTPWAEAGAKLSYPCAIEKDGKLYVGYSNSAFGQGINNNNAELAIIPISELR